MICINKVRETCLWKSEILSEAASNFTKNVTLSQVSQLPRFKISWTWVSNGLNV